MVSLSSQQRPAVAMASASEDPRVPVLDVLLVGYDNQENLGLRSILAYLRSRGCTAELVPANGGVEDPAVVEAIVARPARIVGFSIIFQYSTSEFRRLLARLRERGVRSHFTAGGHFPSLQPEVVLELIPDLDSVVRYEGEAVFLELLSKVDQPERWQEIGSLAFRQAGELILNPPRPLFTDLDTLPRLVRDAQPRFTSTGVSLASILGSRGCPFNCSFCTIRQFYEAPGGELRRLRSPEAVVDEMAELHRSRGVRMFVFQDDDFPVRTPGNSWLPAFHSALEARGLVGKVFFKISCRVDDINARTLEAMVKHGLIAIYFGIESGNPLGLSILNKQVSVQRNLASIQLVKQYDLALAAGFMLFDPASTFASVRENIAFLREIGGDGFYPVNFCKMLPYAGTPIERRLREDGRLKGTLEQPDYSLLDPELDSYAFIVQQIFSQRNFSGDGLQVALQEANFNERLNRAVGLADPSVNLRSPLTDLIRQANQVALRTLEDLLALVEQQGMDALLDNREQLLQLSQREWEEEARLEIALHKLDSGGGGNRLGLAALYAQKHRRELEALHSPLMP
ncbi:MAG: radical SAM protein [Cyanobacteriota bacterium]|nr:radical SAM protein [Cyanobacteriota bacterium]